MTAKLFLLILVFVILPFFHLTIFDRNYIKDILVENTEDRIVKTVDKNKNYVYDTLSKINFYSETLTNNSELIQRLQSNNTDKKSNTVFFNNLLTESNNFQLNEFSKKGKIFLADKNGVFYSNFTISDNSLKSVLSKDFTIKAKSEHNKPNWSFFEPVYSKDGDNELYVSMARSVYSTDKRQKYLGTIIMTIEKNDFLNIFNNFGDPNDNVYVFTKDGTLISNDDKSLQVPPKTLNRLYNENSAKNTAFCKEKIGSLTYYFNFYQINEMMLDTNSHITVCRVSDNSNTVSQMHHIDIVIGVITLSIEALALFMCIKISKYFTKPVKKLTNEMEQYTVGESAKINLPKRVDEFGRLNESFVDMAQRIDTLFDKYKAEEKEKEISRYESIQAQLNPHFLFNTLGTLRWMLVIQGNMTAVTALDSLNSLLRYSMGKEKGLVTIEMELNNIKDYVEIYNLRFQDGINLSVDVSPEIQQLKTIKFILQPIVENSILHGKVPEEPELNINVTAITDDKNLYIYVKDDGVGINDRAKNFEEAENCTKRETMTGIGLSHVNNIIKFMFGNEYGLEISDNIPKGTCVTYTLPKIEKNDEKLTEGDNKNETNNDC